jgi:hypothetical protein
MAFLDRHENTEDWLKWAIEFVRRAAGKLTGQQLRYETPLRRKLGVMPKFA